jgi:integrase
VKGKGWRYDFWMKGVRYADQWFATKKEGQAAEAKRREEILHPKPVEEIPTDITFLELVNLRLGFVEEYHTRAYYKDNRLLFQRVAKKWGTLSSHEITGVMIQKYILGRARDSHYAANYDLRLLKALFNHGVKNKLIAENPVNGIPFLPIEKKTKYVPPVQDIDQVIAVADPDAQEYLWVMRETMGRMSEINQLTWDDVNLQDRYVVLRTRKKKGGNRTPRKVPMTQKLFEVLSRRNASRDSAKPWVFWHECISSKTKERYVGPYQDRKRFMKTLCKKAGVAYFRFHALRHAGASLMDSHNIPIGAIQQILGHENRTTTEIYLHSMSGAAEQAMLAYEAIRQKSHT